MGRSTECLYVHRKQRLFLLVCGHADDAGQRTPKSKCEDAPASCQIRMVQIFGYVDHDTGGPLGPTLKIQLFTEMVNQDYWKDNMKKFSSRLR